MYTRHGLYVSGKHPDSLVYTSVVSTVDTQSDTFQVDSPGHTAF